MEAAATRPHSKGAARWVALGSLCAANIGLGAMLLGELPHLANIIAPLSGHLLGLGLSAGVALVIGARSLAPLALGVALTIGLHAWLGLAPCCRPATSNELPALAAHAEDVKDREISLLTLNTWHAASNVPELVAYLGTAPADIVVLSEFGPPKRALLEKLRHIYPYQTECSADRSCSLALMSRIPFETSGTAHLAAGHAGLRVGTLWQLADGHRHPPREARP